MPLQIGEFTFIGEGKYRVEISLHMQVPQDEWNRLSAEIRNKFSQVVETSVSPNGMLTVTCDFGNLNGRKLSNSQGLLYKRICDMIFLPVGLLNK